MKIFDCFTFFNEFDIIDLRINLHSKFVDYFVVSEAQKTWMRHPKNLDLKEYIEIKHPEYLSKFIFLDSTSEFKSTDPWENEKAQRNYLINGLKNANEEDIIIVSDVDELLFPETVQIFKEKNLNIAKVEIDFFYYNLNWKVNQKWNKVFLCKGSFIKSYPKINFNEIRARNKITEIKDKRVLGAHLSFFYGLNFSLYRKKIQAYNHQEYNREFYFDEKHLEYCIRFGYDLFCRPEIKLQYTNSVFKYSINSPLKNENKSSNSIEKLYFLGYFIKKDMYLRYGIYNSSNDLLYWLKTYLKFKFNNLVKG
jgi:beta-1,4-mannosyl-glycoprotein beta-1,4-N-acetylglucosaminyltransferase